MAVYWSVPSHCLFNGRLPVQNEQPVRSGDRLGFDDCVKPQDLRIGTILTVYGRSFLVHDCDAFTQKWLQVLNIYESML